MSQTHLKRLFDSIPNEKYNEKYTVMCDSINCKKKTRDKCSFAHNYVELKSPVGYSKHSIPEVGDRIVRIMHNTFGDYHIDFPAKEIYRTKMSKIILNLGVEDNHFDKARACSMFLTHNQKCAHWGNCFFLHPELKEYRRLFQFRYCPSFRDRRGCKDSTCGLAHSFDELLIKDLRWTPEEIESFSSVSSVTVHYHGASSPFSSLGQDATKLQSHLVAVSDLYPSQGSRDLLSSIVGSKGPSAVMGVFCNDRFCDQWFSCPNVHLQKNFWITNPSSNLPISAPFETTVKALTRPCPWNKPFGSSSEVPLSSSSSKLDFINNDETLYDNTSPDHTFSHKNSSSPIFPSPPSASSSSNGPISPSNMSHPTKGKKGKGKQPQHPHQHQHQHSSNGTGFGHASQNLKDAISQENDSQLENQMHHDDPNRGFYLGNHQYNSGGSTSSNSGGHGTFGDQSGSYQNKSGSDQNLPKADDLQAAGIFASNSCYTVMIEDSPLQRDFDLCLVAPKISDLLEKSVPEGNEHPHAIYVYRWQEAISSPRFRAIYKRLVMSMALESIVIQDEQAYWNMGQGIRINFSTKALIGTADDGVKTFLGLRDDGLEVAVQIVKEETIHNAYLESMMANYGPYGMAGEVQMAQSRKYELLKYLAPVPSVIKCLGRAKTGDASISSYYLVTELMECSLSELAESWTLSNLIGTTGHWAASQHILSSLLVSFSNVFLHDQSRFCRCVIDPSTIFFDRMLALRLGGVEATQNTSSLTDSPKYIAPELLNTNDMGRRIFPTTELFSFGLLVHFVLTGSDNWENSIDAITNVVTRPLAVPFSFYSKFPHKTAAAEHLIKLCARKSPQERGFFNIFGAEVYRRLLDHPFFWEDNRSISFLAALGSLDPFSPMREPGLIEVLDAAIQKEMFGIEWTMVLEEPLKSQLHGFVSSRSAETKLVFSPNHRWWNLLRFISHLWGFRSGQYLHSLLILLRMFPTLVLRCWEVCINPKTVLPPPASSLASSPRTSASSPSSASLPLSPGLSIQDLLSQFTTTSLSKPFSSLSF